MAKKKTKIYIVSTESQGLWMVFSSMKKAKACLADLAKEAEAEMERPVEWDESRERFECGRDYFELNALIRTEYLR